MENNNKILLMPTNIEPISYIQEALSLSGLFGEEPPLLPIEGVDYQIITLDTPNLIEEVTAALSAHAYPDTILLDPDTWIVTRSTGQVNLIRLIQIMDFNRIRELPSTTLIEI